MDTDSQAIAEPTDGSAVFEFEAECKGIIIETWRVRLRDVEDLDEEELADRLEEALSGVTLTLSPRSPTKSTNAA